MTDTAEQARGQREALDASREQSERRRLRRALEQGPWRRMRADRALGMSPQRGDMVQARGYVLRLEALDQGGGEQEVPSAEVPDVLALDRIERSG